MGSSGFYASRPDWQADLRRRWSQKPAYKMVNLEAWLSEPIVPETLRSQVDLDDPETRRVFSRGWRSRQRLRADGVEVLVLPAAVYERYLGHSETPSTPVARFRYLKNLSYFQSLLEDGQAECLVTFPLSGQQSRGNRIDIFKLH